MSNSWLASYFHIGLTPMGVTLHIETWRILCCHRGRYLTMGNIALAKKGACCETQRGPHLFGGGPFCLPTEHCPPAKERDHFFILGEHVFESPSFCFWNVSPICTSFRVEDAFTSTASNKTLAFRLSSILAVQIERNLRQVRPLDFGLVMHSYLVRRG